MTVLSLALFIKPSKDLTVVVVVVTMPVMMMTVMMVMILMVMFGKNVNYNNETNELCVRGRRKRLEKHLKVGVFHCANESMP